ncbi:hypothetical protein [Lactobacillus pentosus] [Lactiplantibacillus mudanjiangensis]|nr:hypothetical protein [Lactobacillus pentosus] [Lactiplantibacillus mudanjiangensis]
MQRQKQQFKDRGHKVPKALTVRLDRELALEDAYNKKDWSTAAANKIKINNEDIQSSQSVGDQQGINALKTENIKLEFVKSHNVFPEVEDMGVHSVNFVNDLLNIYFPIIITTLLTFMVVPLFMEKYQHEKNMDLLFPKNSIWLENNRFVSGFFVMIFSFVLLICVSVIVSGVFSGFGNLNYPVVIARSVPGPTIPIIKVILEAFILQILALFSIVGLIQLVSNITKIQNLTLLFVIGISVCQTIAASKLAFLNSIVNWIPGTYFNTVGIIDGTVAFNTNNSSVTFISGIIVLFIYNSILILINLLYNKYEKIH